MRYDEILESAEKKMKQIDYKMNELIETDLLSSYINGHGKSHSCFGVCSYSFAKGFQSTLMKEGG